MTQDNSTSVRIDRWLWAARFYKTRALAKTAIEGGKVHINGQRAKASKTIQVGETLEVRVGFDEKKVIVQGVSEKRGPAKMAQQLYTETAESQEKRLAKAAERKAALGGFSPNKGKPDKKQRRQIHQFQQKQQ